MVPSGARSMAETRPRRTGRQDFPKRGEIYLTALNPAIRPCLDCEQMSAHHVFDVGSPVGGAAAAKRADALHHLMITTFGTRALSRRFKLPDEPSFRTYLR